MWLWQAIEEKKKAVEHEGHEGHEEAPDSRLASQFCELFAALEVAVCKAGVRLIDIKPIPPHHPQPPS
jgi:hypothetical protein